MIFIIHSLNMLDDAIALEKELVMECYIPGRDTNQKQDGDKILFDNLEAMKKCDPNIVYCIWDGDSFGTVFDMGMAYALGYQIVPWKLGKDKHWKRFFQQKLNDNSTIDHQTEYTKKYFKEK